MTFSQCFPRPFSLYYQINIFNRGFPAEFLITKYFSLYPGLLTTLYVFGAIQLILSLFGIFMAMGRTVPPDRYDLRLFINRKPMMGLISIWQLALSGLILALPTQWFSNMTMAFILFHAWAEYLDMVQRFMIVSKSVVTRQQLVQFYQWAAVLVILTGVPFMLGSDPYIQGIISAGLVLPADFLNLVVAPLLAYYWIEKSDIPLKLSDKTGEIFRAALSVIHVVWFYGQGIIACTAGVHQGAQFFVALQVLSTAAFLGLIVSYAVSISEHGDWGEPLQSIKSFLACCCCADDDAERVELQSYNSSRDISPEGSPANKPIPIPTSIEVNVRRLSQLEYPSPISIEVGV